MKYKNSSAEAEAFTCIIEPVHFLLHFCMYSYVLQEMNSWEGLVEWKRKYFKFVENGNILLYTGLNR